MYKNCRILNKNTNEIFYGQIDSEFEGKDFYELVEIPDDGKTYKWCCETLQPVIDEDAIFQQQLDSLIESFVKESRTLSIEKTRLQSIGLSTTNIDTEIQQCISAFDEALLNL